MSIKTLDLNALAQNSSNVFEAVVVASKRSRQVAHTIKDELKERLSYYDSFDRELEDKRLSDEQARISIEYEKMLKPTVQAVQEMINQELYITVVAPEDID